MFNEVPGSFTNGIYTNFVLKIPPIAIGRIFKTKICVNINGGFTHGCNICGPLALYEEEHFLECHKLAHGRGVENITVFAADDILEPYEFRLSLL